MIVQNASSTGTTDVSFTCIRTILRSLRKCSAARLGNRRVGDDGHHGLAKLSVVGIGRRSTAGVASRLFAVSARGGEHQLISTSEIKIAVVIDEAELDRAAQATHTAFGLAAARKPQTATPPND